MMNSLQKIHGTMSDDYEKGTDPPFGEFLVGVDPYANESDGTVATITIGKVAEAGAIVRHFTPAHENFQEQIDKIKKYYGATVVREYPLNNNNSI